MWPVSQQVTRLGNTSGLALSSNQHPSERCDFSSLSPNITNVTEEDLAERPFKWWPGRGIAC